MTWNRKAGPSPKVALPHPECQVLEERGAAARGGDPGQDCDRGRRPDEPVEVGVTVGREAADRPHLEPREECLERAALLRKIVLGAAPAGPDEPAAPKEEPV